MSKSRINRITIWYREDLFHVYEGNENCGMQTNFFDGAVAVSTYDIPSSNMVNYEVHAQGAWIRVSEEYVSDE